MSARGSCSCRHTRPISTPLLGTFAAQIPCQPMIEMALPKLKALIRKAARTYEDLWHSVGHVCELFTDEECFNFFNAAGYGTD